MPSTSVKQHNFMEMIAHDPEKAKELGVPQSVGHDFVAADKGRHFFGSNKKRKMRDPVKMAQMLMEMK